MRKGARARRLVASGVEVTPRGRCAGRGALGGLWLALALGPGVVQAQTELPGDAESLETETETETESESESERETERDEQASDDGPRLQSLRLSLGAGLTTRAIALSRMDGASRLETGMVPAVDLHVRARLVAGAAFLALDLQYQTSLWARAAQGFANAGSATAIRSQRAAGGLAPGVRLGRGEDAASLSALLGYGVRAFSSVVPMRVPSLSLHGPLVRLQVEVPVAGLLFIRIEPEGQLVFATAEPSRVANLRGPGMAVGGQASLALRVQPWLTLEASYRESHIHVDSSGPAPLSDVERYLLLGLGARLR